MQPVVEQSQREHGTAHAEPRAQHPTGWLPLLTTGVVMGVFAVIASVSFGALIFSDELASHLATGIRLSLFAAIVVGGWSALRSSYPGMIAGPQHTTAAILALVASSIASALSGTASEETTFLTVVATIVLNSMAIGVLFCAMGWFRLGELIRFIPFPVISGFLAGTGWLLIEGCFHFLVGHVSFWHLPHLLHGEALMQWLPGAAFGIVLFALFLYFHHDLRVLLGMVVAAILVFHVVLAISGTSLAQASEQGWLLDPSSAPAFGPQLSVVALAHADWSAIVRQIPTLATIWLIDLIGLLFGVSTIEIAVHRDLNLNDELKTAGTASLLAGLGGGMSGFPIPSDTALVYKLGAAQRTIGLLAAGVCAVMLLWGMPLLSLCPKLVVGGVLMFMGLDLALEWVYLPWFKLPKADYALVLLILAVIIAVGFLPGVILGVLAAVMLFAINYSRIDVAKHVFSGATHHSHVQRLWSQEQRLREQGDRIHIVELQGVIFFGTAHRLINLLRRRLKEATRAPVQFLVLDFRLVTGLDASAVLSFVKLKQMARKEGFCILFTNPSIRDEAHLRQGGGIDADDKACRVFPDLDRGLEWCEDQLLHAADSGAGHAVSFIDQLKSRLTDSQDQAALMDAAKPVSLAVGDCLFRQGDPSDGLYFLDSGRVSVILQLAEGKTKRLRTYHSGTILGELGLYGNAPRSATVVADEGSRLYYLSSEAFAEIEQARPRLASVLHRFIVELLSERLKFREEELRTLLE